MVRKDGDTMKECMKTNNPTEFREIDVFKFPYTAEIGIDESKGPGMTAKVNFPWYGAKIVNTSYNVNLRAEPSIDSPVIGYVHPNTEFSICAIRTPDWYKVRLKDGTEGYASSKFVAKVMPDEHT